jgi:uncharacterized protein (TIGR03435 family)
MTQSIALRASLRWTLSIALSTLFLLFSSATSAQPQAPTPKQSGSATAPKHRLAFEVISIRPSGKDSGYSYSHTPDGYRATHMTLWSLIMQAYLPMPLWSNNRLQNPPQDKQEYDVAAKIAPEDQAEWSSSVKRGLEMQQIMLQNMLADRCKLALHTIPAETQGFALVTAKHGGKLTPTPTGEPLPKAMQLSDGGVAQWRNDPASGTGWNFHAAPIASLTSFLSHGSHTIIENHTNLTGSYDFPLTHRSDVPSIDHGEVTNPSDIWELEPLGLRTVPIKVPTVTLVIDHIESPSEN